MADVHESSDDTIGPISDGNDREISVGPLPQDDHICSSKLLPYMKIFASFVLGACTVLAILLPVRMNPLSSHEKPFWQACSLAKHSVVSITRLNTTVVTDTYDVLKDSYTRVIHDFELGLAVLLNNGLIQSSIPLTALPPSAEDLRGFNVSVFDEDELPHQCPGLPQRLALTHVDKFAQQDLVLTAAVVSGVAGVIWALKVLVEAAACALHTIGETGCDGQKLICVPNCWRIVVFGIELGRGCKQDCVRLFCDKLASFTCRD